MGQKSNVLTLRNLKQNLNLITENSKLFLYGFTFLKNFEKLLSKKGILVTERVLNFDNNQCFLNLTTFFRSIKMLNYRRKGFMLKKNLRKTPSSILNLFSTSFKLFGTNLIVVSLKNLNKNLDKSIVNFFYKKAKRFTGILFARRFNLFIDFLKFSSFFFQSKISSNSYLFLLGQIFRILPKRKHNRFLFFLKTMFQSLVNELPKIYPNVSTTSSIKGIKFIVNGKLQGKTRASSSCIQVGSVPIQSISKNIEFSKLHVYTVYGAFGFQMWVYRK